MRNPRAASLARVALLLIALAPRPARADDAAARAHFGAGVRSYDAKDYTTALGEFEAAYAAKRSPQIKRNIALCLRGFGRYPEALDALDEMLAEGGETLKPDVKDAARQAIAEMNALVGAVRVRLVYTGRSPPAAVTVLIDERPVPAARLVRPLRLLPGEHVLKAAAVGYFQAEQRVRVAAGQAEAAVDLGLVAAEVAVRGRLNVQTNVPSARVSIDGVEVGVGTWLGDVPVGPHRIDATAQGYPAHTMTVSVQPDIEQAVSIDMASRPEGEAEPQSVRTPRLWFVSGGLGLFGESLTPTPILDGTGAKRDFAGGALVLHAGRRVGSSVSLGLVLELGGLSSAPVSKQTVKETISITQFMLGPEVRVHTSGKLRAFGGAAFGVVAQGINATLQSDAPTGGPRTAKGSGSAAFLLLEGGGQLELGRFFVEASLFLDVHGVGAVDTNNDRFFADSPVARAGLRASVGYTF